MCLPNGTIPFLDCHAAVRNEPLIFRNDSMRLYHSPLSGHSHRAFLFLSLLGIDFETVLVSLATGEHKTPDFLEINPFGQVPVLDDDGTVVPDSSAIMVYLAKKLGRSDWLPDGAGEAAAVQRWLSVAAGEIAFGPCAARLITVFNVPFDAREAIDRAHRILSLVEEHLSGRKWLAVDRPTVADVALYSYIANAPEGNVDIAPYPRINDWLRRVEALPGFVEFPKSAAGLRVVA